MQARRTDGHAQGTHANDVLVPRHRGFGAHAASFDKGFVWHKGPKATQSLLFLKSFCISRMLQVTYLKTKGRIEQVEHRTRTYASTHANTNILTHTQTCCGGGLVRRLSKAVCGVSRLLRYHVALYQRPFAVPCRMI